MKIKGSKDIIPEIMRPPVTRVEHLPVRVHDGVEPVSDGEHSTVSELGADCALNQVISLKIHGGCRLIQDQHLGLTQ